MPRASERILAAIINKGALGITSDRISDDTGYQLPSVRRTMARLFRAGYVTRERIAGSFYYRPVAFLPFS